MSTDPATHTYAETWAGRGVPMDDLAAFVARALAAGAPATARIRLENEDRNILFGLTTPGTRMSVTWPHGHPTTPAGSNVAYSGPGAHPGSYDEPAPSPEPWPFKPGDVVDGTRGDITEWLDAAPVETVVTDDADDKWKHEGRTSWVGTYRITTDELADRAPLTVVSIGQTPHGARSPGRG